MLARVLSLAVIVGSLIAIPLSHSALSAKKHPEPRKVHICHFPDDSEIGKVIEVSVNAVPAHVLKHGDCREFVARPNRDCRCLTCDETCRRTARRCVEDCGDDTICVAECSTALQKCLDACEEGEPE